MWRPGQPAPYQQKKKTKGKKRKNGASQDGEQLKKFLNNQEKQSSKRARKAEQEKNESPKQDLSFVSVNSSAAKSNSSTPGKELSSTLRSMNFMVRQEKMKEQSKLDAEAKRKHQNSQWIISSDLLNTPDGAIVCQPITRAPGKNRGRISYGAYNKNVDNFNAQVDILAEDSQESRRINEAALDADEMADAMQKQSMSRKNRLF